MLARHGGTLMRVARQWSLCHDDALDAFQRGLEIYVRRIDTVEPATEAAWLKVVIRHEALAIRRARSDCVADPDLDIATGIPAAQRSVEEQVLSGDRVSRSAEALRALKPDEARALMLKAHGMSYDEIGRHCGWTYTKVNRAITEGRRRFMEVYEALEEGSECERFAPILEALAAGRATSDQLVEIRPHLRRCTACRATVRDLHRSKRPRLPLLLPLPGLVAPLQWLRERFGGDGQPDELPPQITDILGPGRVPHVEPPSIDGFTTAAPHVPGLETPRLPELDGARVDGIPPSDTVAEQVDRFYRLKQHALSLAHRTNSSDLATGIQIATTTGGGRIATLGAIVGLCLSGVGAGTVCLVTGVLDGPLGLGPEPHRPVVRHAQQQEALPRRSGRSLSAELTAVRPTPTPTAAPQRRKPRVRAVSRPVHTPAPTPTAVPASVDPSQGTAPTSQEHAPISPAPAQPAAEEFAAAPSSGPGTAPAPAPAPATGGGEFGP